MDPQLIATQFSVLRDGQIQNLIRVEGDLQFKIFLPSLAELRGEGFQRFLCCLHEIDEFRLQPFKSESTEITSLDQINRLDLRIDHAELVEGGWVRVFCTTQGSMTGARLRLKADRMSVWDEAFDPVSIPELAILRGKAAGR